MQPRAIETRYQGYRFRSRLEARWAVFFDALGLKWEYEPEGFHLSDGRQYLPDFRIDGVWYEIKPSFGADDGKAKQLAADTGCMVCLLDGPPAVRGYVYFEGDYDDALCFVDPGTKYAPHFYAYGEFKHTAPDWLTEAYAPRVHRAVVAARSARFEHGEKGGR